MRTHDRRAAAAALLLASTVAIGAGRTPPAGRMMESACLVWLAGKAVGSCTLVRSGETGMAVSAVAAGVGTGVALTGVGAAVGGTIVAASTITAGIAG